MLYYFDTINDGLDKLLYIIKEYCLESKTVIIHHLIFEFGKDRQWLKHWRQRWCAECFDGHIEGNNKKNMRKIKDILGVLILWIEIVLVARFVASSLNLSVKAWTERFPYFNSMNSLNLCWLSSFWIQIIIDWWYIS